MLQEAATIMYPVAVRALMTALSARLNAASGVPLDLVIDLNPAIAQRIAAGEHFDVGLTNPHFVPDLIAGGFIRVGSDRPFGRIPLAIARREEGFRPVARSLPEISSLIRGARSIGYTAEGTSGATYLRAIDQLGLAEPTRAKGMPMGAGQPMAAVAAGDIELGVVPLTTILSAPGVALAAIFPDELGSHIDISIFLSREPHRRAAAIVEFLCSAEIDGDLEAAGVSRFTAG